MEEIQADIVDTRAVQPEATEGETDDEKETEEFVINKVVNHRTNKSRNHQYADYGEPLYRVRWFRVKPSDDTWKPTAHLPRSKVLHYVKFKKLAVPDNIEEDIDG